MNATLRAGVCWLAAVAVLAWAAGGAAAEDKGKANATGTWKWTRKTQAGEEQEIKAELKQDGDKVTGKVISPMGEFDVKDGKVKDGTITFKITPDLGGNTVTVNFSGKLDGDRIKGHVEIDANGEKRKLDWNAKRDKKGKD